MDPVRVDAAGHQEYDVNASPPGIPQLRSELAAGVIRDPTIQGPEDEAGSSTTKMGKRRFFGLGKKKWDHGKEIDAGSLPAGEPIGPTSAPSTGRQLATSPPRSTHPYQIPSSPNRPCPSPSPGLPSPASSQIFERDVQEATLTAPTSPAVPSHITRENHIPPVLEASSLAITDDHLDPDEVKIVMHASHQPAALTVPRPSSVEASIHSLADEPMLVVDKEDEASIYGAQDAHDVRRLSFISFADVVNAEHAEHTHLKDPAHHHLSSFAPTSPINATNRSPSPVQSRSSSQGFSPSPPTSGPTSIRGLEVTPGLGIKSPGSLPSTHSPPLSSGGELTVETMRQALKKTGSTDLGGLKSQPLSAVSVDGRAHDVPWR